MIAQSLDVPVAAYPVLEEFFGPLTTLGSVPRRMVHWLREAGVGSRSTLLDLGCGKGGVAIAAAKSLGCHIVGIDAYPPFIESCRLLARKRGVADLCDFRVGPVEASATSKFDAVVMLNVLPFEDAVPLMRKHTKRSGIYVFDDAVRVNDEEEFRAFPDAHDVREWIGSFGDRVEQERVWSASEVRRRDSANYKLLASHASKLMKIHPDRSEVLRECLRRQREGIADLAGPIRPACWLVRRVGR